MPNKSITQLMMDVEMLLDSHRPVALEGWCDIEKAQHLVSIVLALRPRVTVEIGVFGGRSLIPLAMAHAHLDLGVAIGIDPWAKPASLDGMNGENLEWWAKLDHEAIYQGFLRAANRQIALGHLQVIRKTSDEAIEEVKVTAKAAQIDVLHIDGNHGPQAVKDVDNYATLLRPGGILIMDDIDWAAPANTRVNQLGFRHLYDLGTGAVFQR